ncbi:MAG: hypothetical protein PUE01_00360 [Clostridiaceae bacterium]|nr:hypothetical protein [Clostridiaceae bacterium]
MNLKDYREKELKMYIIACIFLLMCLTNNFNFDKEFLEDVSAITKSINTVLISASIYMFSYIADSIISSEFKDKVVNIFGLISKPGEIIFSKIQSDCKDDRIYKEKALKIYCDIYDNMPDNIEKKRKYQNSKWYDIYSKHRDITMIQVSNRDYLLCRDLFFSTISLLILYIASVWVGLLTMDWRFITFLIVMLVVNNIATHIKSSRFAYNVIAYDLSKSE